ncbi:DHHA1 domain-containing protein [Psychrobacillus sp.]|uniref:alanyl-tRNA editing protein n=1 Tax=Psychrobacillus sp. TaxID=1871623 RepID=UPI0028BD56A5|nr:DHHA1 domain-containing protein [Psychrobacillus sp.]
MTNKLYYQDAYIQTFSAKITKQQKDEKNHPYVVLTETAFYPTGGGQPHDTGTLNGVAVTNVETIEEEVRHFLAESLPEETEYVDGSIDWKRRFDHMQQHAGQHILSAAFANLFDLQTVSFHLGKDSATIDLDIAEVTEQQLKEAESLANQLILENRPVETKWITEEELVHYDLRKETAIRENIRLVKIPDFDYNACGGTHPNTTGQVGLINILHTEKQKRIIRVEFVCGERVLTHLHRKQQVIVELVSKLSSPEDKLVDAVNSLLENGKTVDKQMTDLNESLLQYEAKELLMMENRSVITSIFEKRTIQELQKLAKIVVAQSPEKICILLSENGDRVQLVAAKGESVGPNMKELISSILPLINGKGGGNDTIAQGGGESGLLSSEQLLAKALENIHS